MFFSVLHWAFLQFFRCLVHPVCRNCVPFYSGFCFSVSNEAEKSDWWDAIQAAISEERDRKDSIVPVSSGDKVSWPLTSKSHPLYFLPRTRLHSRLSVLLKSLLTDIFIKIEPAGVCKVRKFPRVVRFPNTLRSVWASDPSNFSIYGG